MMPTRHPHPHLLIMFVCLWAITTHAQPAGERSFEQLLPAQQALFEREAENWLLIAGQLWNRQLLLRWENEISRLDSAAPRQPFEESRPPYYYNPVTQQATHDLLIAAAAAPDLSLITGPVVQVAGDHIVVRMENQRVRVQCDPSGYARQMEVQLLVRPAALPDTADTRRSRSSRRDPVFEPVDAAELVEPIDPPALYAHMVQLGITELPHFRPKKVWIDRPQTITGTVAIGPNVSQNVTTTTPGTYRWEWEYHPRRLAFMQRLVQSRPANRPPGQPRVSIPASPGID